jgi:FAD synthetase
MKVKRVMATGTFDIIHPGHLAYLKKAKELGDELIVVIARDSNVKHKPKPFIPEHQRLEVIKAIKWVDKVVLGDKKDIFKPVMEFRPDIIALGYDQHFNEEELEKKLRERGIQAKVVRITHREECELCSTAKIVRKILDEAKVKYGTSVEK